MKLLLKDDNGKFRVIADSAVARSGQPWFLPDFGLNWRWRGAVALRVSRLGKGIAEKYVSRYYDAATKLWVAEADDCSAEDFMDGRVVCGRWIPVEELNGSYDRVARLIAEASEFATLKNGDIVAEYDGGPALPIEPGTTAALSLEGVETVNFNIK